MTETSTPATSRVDQFVAAPPAKVWRLLTEPGLMRLWWAPGEVAPVVGHQFTLDMPGYRKQPCTALEVDPPHRFVHTSTPTRTLVWRLDAEGACTRVFLEHNGFSLDNKRMAQAFERMGPGWRDAILPRLAQAATSAGPRHAAG